MINWKKCGRKRPWPHLKEAYYGDNFLEQKRKTSFSLTGLVAEVSIQDILKVKQSDNHTKVLLRQQIGCCIKTGLHFLETRCDFSLSSSSTSNVLYFVSSGYLSEHMGSV